MKKLFFIITICIMLPTVVLAQGIAQNVTVDILPALKDVVINEFVFDPQTDWDGSGSAGVADEWAELLNRGLTPVDLTGWALVLNDTTPVEETLDGIISPEGYSVLLNPGGSQNNDGQLLLYDSFGRFIDSVTYGNWNDGNVIDNAPDGNAHDINDECLARRPDGIDTDTDVNDFMKTRCTFGSENNFTVVPIHITDLDPFPLCALETDNLTVSAEITGSITLVMVVIALDGNVLNITLPGNAEGMYSYEIDSSQLIGNTTVFWQFVVKDISGDITLGIEQSHHINAITTLIVSPEDPDGLNGWYIAEPTFSLENSNRTSLINYSWDGEIFLYTGPFGLENAPNNALETGGIQVLRYWSNVCGGESAQEFIGMFDFLDPVITDLAPANGSTTTDRMPTISTYLEEMFQSNSGIDLTHVVMELDGSPVPVDVDNADTLDATVAFTPENDLSVGIHEVIVRATDNAGRSSQRVWQFTVIEPPDFQVIIHAPESGIFTEGRLPFNITTGLIVNELEYINFNDNNPRLRRLCSNCDGYGHDRERKKSVNEGENNITVKATDEFGTIEEASVIFIVDSRGPRITRTEPRRGFTAGIFEIGFRETNPEELRIHYGNEMTGVRMHEIDRENECAQGSNYECTTEVDLSDYDTQEISYHVSLTDITGNHDESNPRTVSVDVTYPVINSIDLEVDGRRVTFRVNISEENLDAIAYIDLNELNPREKRLCSSLDDGLCKRQVSFSDGQHNVTIIVRDRAGNTAGQSVQFFTDSRDPKIKSTEPLQEFASGWFAVTFEEANPAFLFLNYENGMQNAEVDLKSCVQDGRNTLCEIFVDLSGFENQVISYWFNLTDVIGQSDESLEREIEVDTVPPAVESFEYFIDERRVTFLINITELNFDKVEWIDHLSNNPRFRNLCTSVNNGLCDRTVSFQVGMHELDIRTLDEAGNIAVVIEGLEFNIA